MRVPQVLIVVATLSLAWGCGGADSPSPPTGPTTTTPPPAPAPTTLSVAGTWTGTLTQPERSTPIPVRSWTATQSGASVTGPMILNVNTGNTQTTLAGTVSGSQLTSVTFTVPFQDGFPPGCSFSGTGTLTASASSITGSLAMTFPAACVGAGSVSNTATSTWTVALTK